MSLDYRLKLKKTVLKVGYHLDVVVKLEAMGDLQSSAGLEYDFIAFKRKAELFVTMCVV